MISSEYFKPFSRIMRIYLNVFAEKKRNGKKEWERKVDNKLYN